MNKKVSVIMSVFNGENTLEESIGFLNDTASMWHLIFLSSGCSLLIWLKSNGFNVLLTWSSTIPMVPPVYIINILDFDDFTLQILEKVATNNLI